MMMMTEELTRKRSSVPSLVGKVVGSVAGPLLSLAPMVLPFLGGF